jgi:hypothetical protein
MFQEKYGDRAAAEIDERTRQAHDGIPRTLEAIKRIAEFPELQERRRHRTLERHVQPTARQSHAHDGLYGWRTSFEGAPSPTSAPVPPPGLAGNPNVSTKYPATVSRSTSVPGLGQRR